MTSAQGSQSLPAVQMSDVGSHSLPPESVIFGRSEAMEQVRQQIERILCASVPLLVTGESGTGKQTLAQYVHRRSCSPSSPFLRVRCSAIGTSLAGSALQKGRLVSAAHGESDPTSDGHATLFLDDVADLNEPNQSELAQLLQDGRLYLVNRKSQEPIEVQLICASTRNLEKEVQEGLFRRDLLHLINVGNVELPRLRDRAGDIPAIVDHLVDGYSRAFRLQANPISAATMTMLQQYEWPGNIRQLQSVIQRYVVLGTENAIKAEMANCDELMTRPLTDGTRSSRDSDPLREATANGQLSLKRAVRDLESRIILRSLEENHWNRRRAAQALHISYRALLYKMKGSGLAERHRQPERQ